jgi:hypothetical protein
MGGDMGGIYLGRDLGHLVIHFAWVNLGWTRTAPRSGCGKAKGGLRGKFGVPRLGCVPSKYKARECGIEMGFGIIADGTGEGREYQWFVGPD